MLLFLEKRIGFNFGAVHINYGARKTAQRDELFCRNFCKQKGIHLEVFRAAKRRAGIPARILKIRNFEDRARKIRYYIFDKLAKEQGFSKVAVAHNLNDQAETVIFNFLRGSGLKGLGGMKYRRGIIIRPLLDAGREEIIKFLKKTRQTYVQDETNNDLKFTRNRIRHELLGEIEEKYNRNIIQTLGRNSLLLRQAQSMLEKNAKQRLKKAIISETDTQIIIDWRKFKKAPSLVKSEAIRRVIAEYQGGLENKSRDLIFKIVNFLDNPLKKGIFQEMVKLTLKKNGDKVSINKHNKKDK